jgi:penicillin-insensitive murein endopeptidase
VRLRAARSTCELALAGARLVKLAMCVAVCGCAGAASAPATQPPSERSVPSQVVSRPALASEPAAAPAPPSAAASTAPAALPALVVGAQDASVAAPPPESPAETTARLARETDALLALPETTSTSIGGPSSGHVQGAVALPDAGPGFVHNAKRPPEARYGTVELVQAIARAAAVVDRELPGSVLVVNDLGLQQGGRIRQHGSHQAGRDADILFYSLDMQNQPLPSAGVPLDPSGKGWDFKDLTIKEDDQRVKLDAPRTWRFVRALLEEAPDTLQRIFIVEHVRALLLAEAQKVRAPAAVVRRFEDITCQPGSPHDDHMHVRLFCSPQDLGSGCEDSPPIYPWRDQLLQALGLREVVASAYRTRAERADVRARTTTPAQAKKRAGRMHPRVVAFLEQREQWLALPHPGRKYCR